METNMPNNRKEYKIKNIGNVVTGKTPPSANPEQFGNEFAFVTPTDFKNYSKNILSKPIFSKLLYFFFQ